MGRGVFAEETIAAGSFITEFRGQVYRTADIPEGYLSIQIEPDHWLCSNGGAIDELINHSCDPNVGFATGEPVLHAIRDIATGEQVCWDYSTSIDEKGWRLVCKCGVGICRRVVRPFSELSSSDRDRLRPIALRYLRERADGAAKLLCRR